MIDVVPVKNEDGLVIMFILTFELQNDKRSPSSSPSRELNRVLRCPWLSVGKDKLNYTYKLVCLFAIVKRLIEKQNVKTN